MQQQEDKRPTFEERVLALLADSVEKISVLSKFDILKITKLVYYESIENLEIGIEIKGKNYQDEFKIKEPYMEWDKVAEANFRVMLNSQVAKVREEIGTLADEIEEREKKVAEIEAALESLNDNKIGRAHV